ncbi:mitochondrial fission ELM1 family protein [Pelagibius sp. 7325]|uniref:mitochondrial fission ELM1 family protein n=1 Tax=Pelagibius sp. 7325 TaxID=3131994 RepID=UPI0030EEB704
MNPADVPSPTDFSSTTDADALAGLSCWVVTDGKAGMEIQCKGLAEALGFMPEIKRISVTKPWRWLPAALIRDPLATLGPKGDRLAPPWPDLWIASGRQTVPLTRDLRRLSGGRVFTVQIQNPAIDPALIDLIVTPEHDRLRAPNVLTTRGSLGQVTPERLAAAAGRFRARYAHLPERRIGVLIGGDNKVFRLDSRTMTTLTERLAKLAREGWGLMITPSRRTGPRNEEILRHGLHGLPADIWDAQGDNAGENPYFGILALADHLVVTGDSVNMVSEACSTGKPVHTVQLQGHAPKFDRFHAALQQAGITRDFDGSLPEWTYTPLAETRRVAGQIRRLLLDHLTRRPAA